MTLRNALLLLTGAALALSLQHFVKEHRGGSKSEIKLALEGAGGAKPEEKAEAPASPSASRRNAIVVAAENVAPAVVGVSVRRSEVVAQNLFFRDPFFEFFGPQLRRREMSSLGSGVIVDGKGHVLTNAHVLGLGQPGEWEAIWVTVPDGRQFEANPVGADPRNDLAVLRIEGKDLPVAPIQKTDDNLIGEWVVAIGNPFGYLIGDPKPTVTVGVISALRRSFSGRSGIHFHNMIQTDASINPGNSGGALVNADGRVIGINTFIFTGGSESQGSIGLGFAIPIDKAMRVLDELVRYGAIREFATGLYADPSQDPRKPGVAVTAVDPKSPADKAGLKPGDVIISVAGKRIQNLPDIQEVFKLFQVGEKVEIRYLRGAKERRAEMILEEKPRKRSIF
jgi:serine protease Do